MHLLLKKWAILRSIEKHCLVNNKFIWHKSELKEE